MIKLGCAIVLSFVAAGCASDRTTRVEKRQMTTEDTPFGGGFPPSHQAGGDPFGRAGDRTIISPRYGADNGAPETRVGGNGDTRLKGDKK